MATIQARTIPTIATILQVVLSIHVSQDLNDSAVDLTSLLERPETISLGQVGMYIGYWEKCGWYATQEKKGWW